MDIPFSTQPGAHERQLRIRYRNPLFPADRQQVSLIDLADAQASDEVELKQFQREFADTFRRAADMGEHVGSETILALKQKCDALYEKACGLGGDLSVEKQNLKRFLDVLMTAIISGAAGDAHALEELNQEASARKLHFRLLQAPVVSDLLRPDSPVAENEWLPTLLSQSSRDLQLALELFDPQQRRDLHQRATGLIRQLTQSDIALPADMPEKLALFLQTPD